MATLTIKNFPDEAYARLTKMAQRNRRSINNEAIYRLENGLENTGIDVEEIIRGVRKHRAKYPDSWLTQEDIDAAKNEGRP